METWEWIVVGGCIGLAVLLAVAFVRVRHRRSHLKDRFGREYERVVAKDGIGAGERRLVELGSERDGLDLRSLPPTARDRYFDEWRQAEVRFVSDPRDAARTAERLVIRALGERGYPHDESDDERLVALMSVDHPDVADRFRHGHAMLANVDGAESTESQRKAMLDFRSVLEDVVEATERSAVTESART
jgi:hypothetical protein